MDAVCHCVASHIQGCDDNDMIAPVPLGSLKLEQPIRLLHDTVLAMCGSHASDLWQAATHDAEPPKRCAKSGTASQAVPGIDARYNTHLQEG